MTVHLVLWMNVFPNNFTLPELCLLTYLSFHGGKKISTSLSSQPTFRRDKTIPFCFVNYTPTAQSWEKEPVTHHLWAEGLPQLAGAILCLWILSLELNKGINWQLFVTFHQEQWLVYMSTIPETFPPTFFLLIRTGFKRLRQAHGMEQEVPGMLIGAVQLELNEWIYHRLQNRTHTTDGTFCLHFPFQVIFFPHGICNLLNRYYTFLTEPSKLNSN